MRDIVWMTKWVIGTEVDTKYGLKSKRITPVGLLLSPFRLIVTLLGLLGLALQAPSLIWLRFQGRRHS